MAAWELLHRYAALYAFEFIPQIICQDGDV